MAASGRHSDRQLPRNAELLNEADERLAEVSERLFFGIALAVSADTGTKLGMCTPHGILVALDDDRHSNGGGAGLCHVTTITARAARTARALRPSDAGRVTGVHALPVAAQAVRHADDNLRSQTAPVWVVGGSGSGEPAAPRRVNDGPAAAAVSNSCWQLLWHGPRCLRSGGRATRPLPQGVPPVCRCRGVRCCPVCLTNTVPLTSSSRSNCPATSAVHRRGTPESAILAGA